MITPEALQAFAGVAAVVVLLGSLAVALQRLGFLRRSDTAPAKAPDMDGDTSARLERHAERLTRLEAMVAGLASRDDITELRLEMERQTGSLKEIRALMKGNAQIMARLETVVTRHEDHLLERGSK